MARLYSDKLLALGTRLVPESVRRASWLRPRYPLVGIELREEAVLAVRLQKKGTGYRIASHARRSLAPGVFSASLMNPGVGDEAALSKAIGDVLRQIGAENAGRVSVTLPDSAVRVFMIDLQEMPAARAQADEIVRFRIRKSIPFRPEEMRLSWDVLGTSDDGRVQILVALAPDRAVRPVEDVLERAGLRCGLIDLATFDVFNVLRLTGSLAPAPAPASVPAPAEGAETPPAAGGRDVGLLNATPGYFSMMILRNGQLIFYRSKSYHVQGSFQGEESLRVVGRELRSTLGYYEEHLLGEGIRNMYVRVTGIEPEGIVDVVRAAGCGEVQAIDPRGVVADAEHLDADTALELIPALGLALRRMA